MDNPRIAIIGQGLAGTAFSIELFKRNVEHVVIDKPGPNKSSMVAAGIINPVTGRRLALSWMYAEHIAYARELYGFASSLTGNEYLNPLKIQRLYSSVEEENIFEERMSDPLFEGFINRDFRSIEGVKAERGGFTIQKGYRLSTKALVTNWRNFLESHLVYHQRLVDYSNLPHLDEIGSFDLIAFAEGYKAKDNPFFKGLELQPVHGDILEIEVPQLRMEQMISSGNFLVPDSMKGRFLFGSTYNWDRMDPRPLDKGKEFLCEKAGELIEAEFRVVGHRSGIRPSSKDRRPLLGQSKSVQNMFIINGLGSKGSLLAPLQAKNLADLILEGKPLSKTVDWRRWDRLKMT